MSNSSRGFAITILTALAVVAPTSLLAAPPDLCAERVLTTDGAVYEDTTGLTLSRWCEPHTDPPGWTGGSVCCSVDDEARCDPPDPSGRCTSGQPYTCDYGELLDNEFVCYEPGPSACELDLCVNYEPTLPQLQMGNIWLCCTDNVNDVICHYAGTTNNGEPPDTDCSGFFAICTWGQTNLDGSVGCWG